MPPTSTVQRFKCKVASACSVDFEGQQTLGTAHFQDSGLVEVVLYTGNGNDLYGERLAKLRSRYGPPTVSGRPPKGTGLIATVEALDYALWRSPAGDSIELTQGGFLRYRSAARNRAETAGRKEVQY
jgi:hypothetical protein